MVSSSVQWGAWGGVGMAAHDATMAKRLARVGMGSLTPRQGLSILQDVLVTPAIGTLLWQPHDCLLFCWLLQ